MPVVQEAPVPGNKGVEDGHAAVERKFGDLVRRKLSVRISEFADGFILGRRINLCQDAVISRLFHGVLNRLGVVQVNGLRQDVTFGLLVGIARDNKLPNTRGVALAILYVVVVADCVSLV